MSATAASSQGSAVGISPLARWLIAAVVFLDLSILAGGWILGGPQQMSWDVFLWILLVASVGSVRLTSGKDQPWLSMDLPLLLGASFIFGPTLSGTIAFAGTTDPRELRRGVSLSSALFNRAQTSLSVMAASVVFRATAGSSPSWPWVAVAALVALVADCLVNYSTVAFMTSLVTRRRFRLVLTEMRIGTAEVFVPTYACFGFIGLLLADAFVSHGFWGLIAFVAPILLARAAFEHRRLFESASRALDARKAALRRVDERIAEERRDERMRIAESLHDEVLQCLYNVTIRTQVIREDLRRGRLLELDDDVPALLSASERAVEELRDVIRDLRRSPIGQTGLVDTLVLLVNHLRDETEIKFVTDIGTLHADASTELVVYQIAREALLNAVKHSAARTIWVKLSAAAGSIRLSVQDDGVGFDMYERGDGRHFGLALMAERVGSAAGRIEIRSSQGNGTLIEAAVPFQSGPSGVIP